MRLLEPNAQIWMKIVDPYYQRQKCRPMTLCSFRKYKVHADIRGGSIGRGRQTTLVVVDDGYFWRFIGGYDATSSNTSKIRQAILYDDMLPLSTGKWLQNKWMTLSGYFMTKCIFGQHFLNQSVWMSEIVQPLQFCGVQLASLRRHAQLTRCLR